jgi:Protein of unknown function (DUF1553)/Protein of unknown function (DUF1549)/Planctomycete cytochrome C
MFRSLIFAVPCALIVSQLESHAADDPKGLAFFESKIRPVLVENCYECHSAAAIANKKLRGGLLLDTREGLLKGGDTRPAIVPGKAKDSLVIKVLHQIGDVKMPPKGKLTASVIADFETWINMGAPDPRTGAVVKQKGLTLEEGRKFWAFQPVKKPSVPQVRNPETAIRNEIDLFIRAQLDAKVMAPSPEADPVTLIRRVYFDLIGLPPTPEEIDAFVKGYSAKPQAAYEELVDRLLASPHFGERWGRHWLDVARYAESMTLRGFVFKEAWRYRDYVIESFNNDVPFDRFIREQIAGDLLPSESMDQRRRRLIATTYLTLGNTNLEEQDKKQLVMDVVDEQLDAISKGIIAQTITCARCHDHKFDPIPTKDYYAIAGILKNTKTLEHANVSKWLEMPLPADPDREKVLKEYEASVVALQKEIAALKGVVAKNTKPANPNKPTVRLPKDLPGIVVDDSDAKKVGEWKTSTFSGSYVDEGYIHDEDKGKGEKTLTFQPMIPKTGKYEVRLAYSPGTNRCEKVPVTIFSADGEKMVYVDEKKPPEIEGLFHSLGQYTFEKSGQGFVIIENEGTKGHVIADAVVFIPVEDLANLKEARPMVEEKAKPDADKLKALEDKLKKMQASGPKRELTMSVQEEKKIDDVRVHIRGIVHNLGEVAPRGFLQVATFGPTPKFPSNESGRRQLADWLASNDNPLTARVFANRAWHWLFGSGLVRTTDNFGTTGEKPSHPELLDYLASRFMDDGWSTKKLVRLIVLSHTYRQASNIPQANDPENRSFARQNRRRMDAECIRDTILWVSGQLKLDMTGPTFKTDLAADYGYKHGDTRRSVYSPVFRNSLPELFEAFDFADPSVCTGKRNVSTVAPQALFLMNNPLVIQQARAAAQRLLDENDLDDGARVAKAFRLTLGRTPSEKEKAIATTFLNESGRESKKRLESWSQFVQTLIASVDFRYVE